MTAVASKAAAASTSAGQRRRRAQRTTVVTLDAQIGEIVEVLRSLGGEAHRTLVLQQIARRRLGGPGPMPAGLEQSVVAAFEAHCRLPADVPARVISRFGAGSHRWALA